MGGCQGPPRGGGRDDGRDVCDGAKSRRYGLSAGRHSARADRAGWWPRPQRSADPTCQGSYLSEAPKGSKDGCYFSEVPTESINSSPIRRFLEGDLGVHRCGFILSISGYRLSQAVLLAKNKSKYTLLSGLTVIQGGRTLRFRRLGRFRKHPLNLTK